MRFMIGIPLFKSSAKNDDIRLSDQEKINIKNRAKAFQEKLMLIGKDGFVRQHENARKEEIGIYCAAQYCIADYDTSKDYRFGTPAERYEKLLHKAQKYQTDKAIDAFTKEKSEKYEEDVKCLKTKVDDLTKKLDKAKKELNDLLKDKTTVVRQQTKAWMKSKIDNLEYFFKESQDISDRHKEVKEQLKNGELP